VKLAEPLGANTLLHGAIEGSADSFTVSLQGVHQAALVSDVRRFHIEQGKAHVFDVETGLRRAADTDKSFFAG
jgi:sn-glycerol 3-phosphate transport system ATP-binding protein